MRLEFALLCDAVTVREGLMHILGGGISHVARPTFPAPLAADLAVMFEFAPGEPAAVHDTEVILRDPVGGSSLIAGFTWSYAGPPPNQPEFPIKAPLTIGAREVSLAGPGPHAIEVVLDGVTAAQVAFLVVASA